MGMNSDEIDTYCDLQMTTEQGLELLELAKQLRADGKHPRLDSVFHQIQQEIESSVDYNANYVPFSLRRRQPH